MKSIASLALCAGFLLAGAASAEDAPAKGDPRVGEEVSKICFARDINGWKEIDGEDDVVLLETGVNDWHRVELSGACSSRIFRFAQWIGIDERPRGGCVTRGDVIVVRDTGNFTHRCVITKINKWHDDLPPPADDDADPRSDDNG